MLPETMQLEKLRQQIEDAEYQSGSTSDYLDRGNPNPQQAQTAREYMARMDSTSKELKIELRKLIPIIRNEKPQAFKEWVNLHKDILQKILTETGSDINAKVRQNLARTTLQEWEKVLLGERDYVDINASFLKDYMTAVREWDENNNHPNPWWKFW